MDSRVILMIAAFILSPCLAYADTILVDCNGGGDYLTIQEGVDASVPGDTVLVAPGTYIENVQVWEKDITLQSTQGPDATIIDGSTCTAGSDCSTIYLVGCGQNFILDDFTITGGLGSDFIGGGPEAAGGGIFCNDSAPTITNCRIENNHVEVNGGGIYIVVFDAAPIITNCTVADNSAGLWGGGIAIWGSQTQFRQCTIADNSAGLMGGGIFLIEAQDITIVNCMITGNSVDEKGGGMWVNENSNLDILHSTFSDNFAFISGGGIYFNEPSSATILSRMIANSIFWGNISFIADEIAGDLTGVVVEYSDVQMAAPGDVWPGTGNINEDPLFVGGGDFHLAEGSPCIDASVDASVYIDIDGDTRPQEGGFDMGADEYVPDTCFLGFVM